MIKDPVARAAYKHRWYLENRDRLKPAMKARREAHRERITELTRKWRAKHREALRDKHRAYRIKNREKINAWTRRWRKNNPEKCLANKKRWASKNPDYRSKNLRARLQSDIQFRIVRALRRRLCAAIKDNAKSGSTIKLLGCSIADFKIYLESRFDIGMSWENHGKGPGKWHVDHIMPCAIFDLSRPDHQKRCFHFSNLQPMWGSENIRKGAKTLTNQFNLL